MPPDEIPGRAKFETPGELLRLLPAEPDWLLKPWICRGTLTVVSGQAKAGKSTLVADMIGAILDESAFLDELAKQAAGVLVTEMDSTPLVRMLVRARLDGSRDLRILRRSRAADMSLTQIIDEAVAECHSHGLGFIVIDGAASQWSPGAESSSRSAHEAIKPLQWAASEGLAVVLILPDRKAGGPTGTSIRGSGQWSNAADIIVGVSLPRGQPRTGIRVLTTLSRYEETPRRLLIELTSEGYVALAEDARAYAQQEARSFLLQILPVTEGDAADWMTIAALAVPLKRSSLMAAMATLVEEGQAVRIGRGVRGDPYRFWRHESPACRRRPNTDPLTPVED